MISIQKYTNVKLIPHKWNIIRQYMMENDCYIQLFVFLRIFSNDFVKNMPRFT